MNLTRLMALGALASQGDLHGHQIRRWAEATGVGHWGGVSVGALYRELRTMEAEGLIEAVRTEKVGRRPARTVYTIAGEGQLELGTLRENAIRDLVPGPDPLGVALTFAGPGDDPEAFADLMRVRREQLAIMAGQLKAETDRLAARGCVNPVQESVMRRGVMHMEAEVSWHDQFAKVFDELPEAGQPSNGQPSNGQPSNGQPGNGQRPPRTSRGSPAR